MLSPRDRDVYSNPQVFDFAGHLKTCPWMVYKAIRMFIVGNSDDLTFRGD